MKRTLGILLFSLMCLTTNAQSNWCATDDMLEQWFELHPEDRERFLNPPVQSQSTKVKGSNNTKAPNYIIPVVVHVIHFNGAGNISKAQIEDGLEIINDDFNKRNADTSNVRNVFKSYIADAQIEFKLAQKDPSGNCTDGINRINSFLSYGKRNEVKRLGYWNAKKYFNVWIVNSINSSNSVGTVLGYAQFPRFGADSTYGLVVRANEWGSIELAATKDGRTATHEVGHCLDLLHTFQSGCGFNCSNSGDRVCDTPPQFSSNNNSCDTTLNSCSNDSNGGSTSNPNPYTSNVPDQLENYMGYGLTCLGMFSEGQKTRMENALTQVTKLVDLTKSTNLVATGTNTGYIPQQCAPVADLYFETKLLCKGSSVSFEDNSYRDTITSYEWTFQGGTPSTSTAAKPSITYNTPGVYEVKLKVSNSVGSDSIVVKDQIIVYDTANAVSGFGYFEGFENSSNFNDWTIISPTGSAEWVRTSLASYAGNNSAYLNNFQIDVNSDINAKQYDYMISPPIDMSQVVSPSLRFKVAYMAKDANSLDQFKVEVSTDCGESWTSRVSINPSSSLISSGTSLNNFIPNSTSQWKTINLTLKSAMRSSKHLLVRFNFTSGDGNNMFIDDFEVIGSSIVGLSNNRIIESNFNIYPNPTGNNGFYLEIEDNKNVNQAQLYITNIVGEKIKEIVNPSELNSENRLFVETNEFGSGVYFITYQNGGRKITKKLIIN